MPLDTGLQLEALDLLARSAYALDERLMDDLEATFSREATLEIDIAGSDGIVSFSGREAIMGLMQNAADTQTDVRRHVTTNSFFGAGSTADEMQVTSNLTITAVENGAIRLITSGYYKDTIIREDGRLRLKTRRIQLDMAY